MGFLSRVSSVAGARRASLGGADDDRWYVPASWLGQLTNAGVRVNPELAMTLSAVFRAVSCIAGDISRLSCQLFRRLDNGGKELEQSLPLAHVLRWEPNVSQVAMQFWSWIVMSMLQRGNGYARILPGERGAIDQLDPIHPDLVRYGRLPSRRVLYYVRNGQGGEDPYTQDEIFHVPNILSADSIGGMSCIAYGLQSFGGMLAAESAAQHFFKNGMVASHVVNVKGEEMNDEEKRALHTSLSLYASGVTNHAGFLLLNEDMSITSLAVEPEKAQLLQARQHGVKDVARWFGMPGHKLEAEMQTQAYSAREQANLEYVIGTIGPLIVMLEQCVQKAAVIDKRYVVEFDLSPLLFGDMKSRADYYEKMIRSRVMRPSEVRMREKMNPDAELDRQAALLNRAGEPQSREREARQIWRGQSAGVRASLLARELALTVARKERARLQWGAKQHANNADGWQSFLAEFYAEHAQFIAAKLHVPLDQAHAYAQARRAEVYEQDVSSLPADFEQQASIDLATWALEGTGGIVRRTPRECRSDKGAQSHVG